MRAIAISWWNNEITVLNRRFLTTKYHTGRRINSLTGREIEIIYRAEKQ